MPVETPPLCHGHGLGYSLTQSHDHPELSGYPTIDWPAIVGRAYEPQNVDKDKADWVLPANYTGRMARLKSEQLKHGGEYYLLSADIDVGHLDLATVVVGMREVLDPGTEFLVYATRTSKPIEHKWRTMVPCAHGIPAESFHHVATTFNDALHSVLGVSMDPITTRLSQYLYLANRGAHYEFHYEQGVGWGATDDLTKAQLVHDVAQIRLTKDPITARANTKAAKQGEVLRWFSDRYDVELLLHRYGFNQNPHHRPGIGSRIISKWHHPDQSTSSFGTDVHYDNHGVKRWVTSSGSVLTVMGKHQGDAFDLFVTFEGGGNFGRCYAAIEQAYNNDRALEDIQPFTGVWEDGSFRVINYLPENGGC